MGVEPQTSEPKDIEEESGLLGFESPAPERPSAYERKPKSRPMLTPSALDDLEANDVKPLKPLETEGKKQKPSGAFGKTLAYLDEIDKKYSRQLQNESTLGIELPLILPALFWNRAMCAVGIVMSCGVGALRCEVLLSQMGYREVKHELDSLERFRYGLVFMIYYALSLLVMVTSTQILKYTIRRERPQLLTHTKRLINLRKHENGTFSMPSGDSSAAAVFCFLYAAMLYLPAIYLVLPLVMAGRVYY